MVTAAFILLIIILGATIYYTIKLTYASDEYSDSNPFIKFFHNLDEEEQLNFIDSLEDEYQSMFQTMLNIELEPEKQQLLIDRFNKWAKESGTEPFYGNESYYSYNNNIDEL